MFTGCITDTHSLCLDCQQFNAIPCFPFCQRKFLTFPGQNSRLSGIAAKNSLQYRQHSRHWLRHSPGFRRLALQNSPFSMIRLRCTLPLYVILQLTVFRPAFMSRTKWVMELCAASSGLCAPDFLIPGLFRASCRSSLFRRRCFLYGIAR